jgi:hypothetical protein
MTLRNRRGRGDDKYIVGTQKTQGRACDISNPAAMNRIANTNQSLTTCWINKYKYCDETAVAYSSICKSNLSGRDYAIAGGRTGQDCASFRIVVDFLFNNIERSFNKHSHCEQLLTKSIRNGNLNRECDSGNKPECQEDTFANPGSRSRTIGGFDNTTMVATLTKRSSFYSDFHLHFHNTASVIGEKPSERDQQRCALCHTDGTEWNRPILDLERCNASNYY